MMSLVMEMETFRLLTANLYQVTTSTGYTIKRGIVKCIICTLNFSWPNPTLSLRRKTHVICSYNANPANDFKSSAVEPYVASRRLRKDHNYDDQLKALLTQLNQIIPCQ